MRLMTLIASLTLAGPAFAGDPPEMTDCDRLAAHPSDPDHLGPGVGSGDVVTHRAIPACRAALEADPDNPRLHYQLGRVLVYWADANGADRSEGIEHVRHAAAMDYTQALFVLGLLQQAADACAAEPLTRQAAEQGLKAARIAYVDAYTAGVYANCSAVAHGDSMRGYLDAATAQASGYYEHMLLGSLRRQLDD